MNIGLKYQLETFLENICDGNEILQEAKRKADKNVLAEDVFRDKIYEYLRKHQYPTDTEAKTDSKPGCGEDYWLIDLMVMTLGFKQIPIEVKFNEESRELIGDDKEKIDYCIHHNKNMEEGYVILLTSKEKSNFEEDLKPTAFQPYRFALWHLTK